MTTLLRKLILLCAVSVVFTLSACGQKGPLYLPQSDQSQEEQEDSAS